MTRSSRADASHKLLGWLPLLLLPLAAIACRNRVPAWGFMWILASAIYFGLKWLMLCRTIAQNPRSKLRAAGFLFFWPGMDADAFLDETQSVESPRVALWAWAIFQTAVGAVLIWVVARSVPTTQPLARGWVGMLGLILVLHFGTFQLTALFWQSVGVNAEAIMSQPLRSTSLAEFWGKRWNLGFRELAHELIFRPLSRTTSAGTAGMAVFLVSGLVHDLVISVPARGGYGLPTLYFTLQGIGVMLQRSSFARRFGVTTGPRGWCFTMLFLIAPLFWLFHPYFVLRVILPFMQAIHAL